MSILVSVQTRKLRIDLGYLAGSWKLALDVRGSRTACHLASSLVYFLA